MELYRVQQDTLESKTQNPKDFIIILVPVFPFNRPHSLVSIIAPGMNSRSVTHLIVIISSSCDDIFFWQILLFLKVIFVTNTGNNQPLKRSNFLFYGKEKKNVIEYHAQAILLQIMFEVQN